MAKKTFNEVGDTDDKVTWNAAGTRKWRMTYTLLEVKPSWRRQTKTKTTAEESNSVGDTSSRKTKRTTKSKPKKASVKTSKSKAKKRNNRKSTKQA